MHRHPVIAVTCVAAVLSASGLQPTEAAAETRKNVNVNVQADTENFMWTITKSSFYGGIFGALVGLSGMLFTQFEMDPAIVGMTTGGGILLGGGVGVWEVSTRDDVLVANGLDQRDDAVVMFG